MKFDMTTIFSDDEVKTIVDWVLDVTQLSKTVVDFSSDTVEEMVKGLMGIPYPSLHALMSEREVPGTPYFCSQFIQSCQTWTTGYFQE